MNWELGIDVHALPYVKLTASGNLLYSTGSLAQYSVMTSMSEVVGVGGCSGRKAQGGGIYVYIQLIHIDVQ